MDLRPGIRVLSVASLALCGWLHARGFNALVGGSLAAPDVHFVSVAQAAPEPQRPTSADPILARNAFDSETGPLIGDRAASPASSADFDGTAVRPCEGLRVVSIVAFADPGWSFVVLDVQGERDPLVLRRGGEVLAIAHDRVLLDRGGSRCVARMFARPPQPPVAASQGALRAGIARIGDGSFVVDRSVRDALIDGAADLMRSVAVRPEKKGDDVIGLRIASLQPGTPLDALGVHGGDVLLSMNGIRLDAPDRMLEAYARARTEPHLRLDVMRDGREFQLDYDVR